jgi:hypothetical protein
MVDDDISRFAQMLEDVWTLYPSAKPLSSGQATMFFRALAQHPLHEVQVGFDRHVKDTVRGRFPPVPADVLAQIENVVAADGRPGPEEAWAIAVVALDENKTVIWTSEMRDAWGIARSVAAAGDEVGARMAFREAYNRLVDEARATRRPVSWEESTGFDPVQRVVARMRAETIGRLPAPRSAYEALPAPEDPNEPIEQRAQRHWRSVWQVPENVRAEMAAVRERLAHLPDRKPIVPKPGAEQQEPKVMDGFKPIEEHTLPKAMRRSRG